ncbi:hypothetical protein Krac_4387 [Ktedonobacter racemifer DSM 44963]|uniref:Uncharacterized protein n=1 Tax=Ktedonobacter racemifer DSM 44963 TaxID=485913 RepID=D6TSM8_KTERA|nr:hypothetical protein Krac_4387 [Ktedonobacter racemifer DSM 44963]
MDCVASGFTKHPKRRYPQDRGYLYHPSIILDKLDAKKLAASHRR